MIYNLTRNIFSNCSTIKLLCVKENQLFDKEKFIKENENKDLPGPGSYERDL